MEQMTNVTPWVVSEIKLAYKTETKAIDRSKITTSRHCYEVLQKSWDHDAIELYEQFKVIYLDRASRVLAIFHASTGGVSGTLVDSRLIFAAALRLPTSAIILAHNHPSGEVSPSQSDISLTKTISEGAKLLGISVIDHIILSANGYYSFADEGII